MQNIINIIMTNANILIPTDITIYNTSLVTALVLLIITHKLLSNHRQLTLEKAKTLTNEVVAQRIILATVRPTNLSKGVHDIHVYHNIGETTGYDALQKAKAEVKSLRKAAIADVSYASRFIKK